VADTDVLGKLVTGPGAVLIVLDVAEFAEDAPLAGFDESEFEETEPDD